MKEYRRTARKNRQNGVKGGRPSNSAASSITQEKPTGLPNESQNNPNHKPRTINHKPITTIEKQARFAKPTLTELFNEFVGRVTNPEKESESFFNYYESNGWKVGKNPMKSWKHAVTNWINRGKQNAKPAFAENPNDTILREKYPHLFPHQ